MFFGEQCFLENYLTMNGTIPKYAIIRTRTKTPIEQHLNHADLMGTK